MALSKVSTAKDSTSFVCGETPEYIFCAPVKENRDFFVAVLPSPKRQIALDVPRIQKWFDNSQGVPAPVKAPLDLPPMPKGSRIYKVNGLLPRFVLEHNAKNAETVGPNCHQATLSAAGFEKLSNTFVDLKEMKFYMDIFFEPSSACLNGGIAMYRRKNMGAGDSDHSAYVLPAGLVFQKSDIQTIYFYRIIRAEDAISSAAADWRPQGEDRFGNPQNPWLDTEYEHSCFARRARPLETISSVSTTDFADHMDVVNFYLSILEGAARSKWSEFGKKRATILMLQNMGKTYLELKLALNTNWGGPLSTHPKRKEVAALLRLDSLLSQHGQQTKAFDDLKGSAREEEVLNYFRTRYFRDDELFRKELDLILKLRKVPQEKRVEVAEKIISRIKKTYERDIENIAATRGSAGINYFQIIDDVLKSSGI